MDDHMEYENIIHMVVMDVDDDIAMYGIGIMVAVSENGAGIWILKRYPNGICSDGLRRTIMKSYHQR